MNILELKRSARGYSYREGGDQFTSGSRLVDYSQPGWTFGGADSGYSFNPVVAARSAAAAAAPAMVAKNGPSAGQSLGAVTGVSGQGGDSGGPLSGYLEAYESSNPDGTVNRYDTNGNFVTTYTPNGDSFWSDFGNALGEIGKIALVGAGLFYGLPALASAFGGGAAAAGAGAAGAGAGAAGLAAGELGLAGGTALGAGNLGVAGAMGGTFAPAISAPVTNALITSQTLDALPVAYSTPVSQSVITGTPIGSFDAGTTAAMQGGFGSGANTATSLNTYAPRTLGSGTFDAGLGNILSTTVAPTVGQGAVLAPAATAGTGAMGAGLGGAATTAAGEIIGAGTAAAGANALTSGAGNALTNFLTSPAGIQAGASLAGGVISAAGANAAANTQADAADRALTLQREIYDSQKTLQEPYRTAGITAQNRLLDYLGLSANTGQIGYGKYAGDFGIADFEADPGYSFRLSEGQKLLDRIAARNSKLFSGGALKGATRYGQEMASQEFNNAYNRYQTNRTNQLQPLGNLMTTGQNAATNVGSAAGQYGTNAANLINQGGQATAAGQLGIGNTINNAIGAGVSAYQNNNLLDILRRQNTSSYLNPYAIA